MTEKLHFSRAMWIARTWVMSGYTVRRRLFTCGIAWEVQSRFVPSRWFVIAWE